MARFSEDLGLKELIFFPIKLDQFLNFIQSFLQGGFVKGTGVLLVLREYGPMPISHIGEKMRVRKSNMTAIIDDLEQKGLVVRLASSEDRRIINIKPTDEGLLMLDKVEKEITKILEEKTEFLSDAEVIEGTEAIHSLTKVMSKIIEQNKAK